MTWPARGPAIVLGLVLALGVARAAPADALARARALLAAGRAEEALLAIDDALEARPDELEAWRLRARAHEALGELEAAASDQGERLRRLPDRPGEWVERARLRRLRGDVAGALEDLQRAIALGADDARTREGEAELLLAKGRAREALHALSGLPQPDPRLQARARACAGDLGGAREALDRRLEAAPGDARARLDRALLRALQGDLRGARADAETADRGDPAAVGWAVLLGADPQRLAPWRADPDPWVRARARWIADDRASDALVRLAARADHGSRRARLREAHLLRAIAPLGAGRLPDRAALQAARELGLLAP